MLKRLSSTSGHQFVFWVAALLICSIALRANAIEPDFLMDADPEFVPPERVKQFDSRYRSIWIAALERPEIDMQRMAAESIARGHQLGMSDLKTAVPLLEKILLADASHPAARFAAARALTVLDARDSAESLLNASQLYGADLRQLVEPALGRWSYAGIKPIWIKRLDNPKSQRRDLILAIRGLGQVKDASALPALMRIVTDSVQGADLRLEAATAAGELAETGLDAEADKLSRLPQSGQFVNPLCALRLLRRHRSPESIRLMVEFANGTEATVVAAALTRLNEIDPALVLPMMEASLQHADHHVRAAGVIAGLAQPSPERVTRLGQLLNDRHPLVRCQVAEGLLALSNDAALRESIVASAVEALQADKWAGQEQAALLLGRLEYKPMAGRLAELLDSPQPAVMVAAAWALRKVAVADTIPKLVERVRRVNSDVENARRPGFDHHVGHLFEALGLMKSPAALKEMASYVPHNAGMGERSRSAAIWALGRLSEGVPHPELSKALLERATDNMSRPPESDLVKQLCAVSLARIKAVDQAAGLRQLIAKGTPPTKLGLALRWAIHELTGETLPEPVPTSVDPGNWFLEPIH